MEYESNKNSFILSFFLDLSLFFTVLSFSLSCLMTIILSFHRSLPTPKVNFIVLAISIILSILYNIIKDKLKIAALAYKLDILYYFSVPYSIIYIIYYSISYFKQDLRSIYAMTAILCACITFGLIEKLVPLKNLLYKGIIYFTIFAIPYLVTTLAIAKYGQGNKIFMVFFVYLISFAIIYSIYVIIYTVLIKVNNENQSYKQMFN